MKSREIHIAALAVAFFLIAFVFLGKRQVVHYREFVRTHPFTYLARELNGNPGKEWCDDELAARRLSVASIVDKYREEIGALWNKRGSGGQPKFSLLDLGPIQLRVNPKAKPGTGFDSTSWSWDDAAGLVRKLVADPEMRDREDRIRDLDSMVRFLTEKDYAREFLGRKFLPPEITQHQFVPNPSVKRTGEREFTVELDAGDFRGHEAPLTQLLESEWQGGGYRVKLSWVTNGAYRLLAHKDSNRSFVNHKRRVMEIAHLAWTKTVAHELGHVLGFDDHYYNVWNSKNCYYSQESRLGDLMSNSEHGAVTARHWQVLDEAYPWKGEAKKNLFQYVYGKEI